MWRLIIKLGEGGKEGKEGRPLAANVSRRGKSLYCTVGAGEGGDEEEEEIGNGTRDRKEGEELRRRGLFNSNLPTQSVRLSLCLSAFPTRRGRKE